MKRVFITGVSGYLGGKIADALARDARVETLVGIDIREPAFSNPKLTFVHRDVRAPLADILNRYRIDTVIHAAYVLPPIHDKILMEGINVSGTRNVLAACEIAKIRHLLYLSSTTAYGFHPDNPVPLTEESPLRGNDNFTYSKNKKEIEAILKAFINSHQQMTVTILRACFVVGPGFDNPLARYLKKRWVLLPVRTARMQFVHEDDLVRVIRICLEKQIGGAYNVSGEGTVTFQEMVRLMGGRRVALPFFLLYVLNFIAWHLRLTSLSEFPSTALNMIRYPWIASPRRLSEKTGFRCEYDSRSAFEDFARCAGAIPRETEAAPARAVDATGTGS